MSGGTAQRGGLAERAARRTVLFVAALGLAAVAWEFYKAIGPEQGGDIFGWRIIPKTNDRVMPHVWEMLAEFGDPAIGSGDQKVWSVLLGYSWFTFRMALAGLVVGTTIGIGLAVFMARLRVVERGLAAVPGDLADDSAHCARSAGHGHPGHPRSSAVDIGGRARSVPLVLPDHRVDAARACSRSRRRRSN